MASIEWLSVMPYLHYALLVIIAWGLLTAGAVEPWAYWPLALASAVVGGLALSSSFRTSGRSAKASAKAEAGPDDGSTARPGMALLAGFGLLAGATALQLVSIDRPWILRLSPTTDAYLQRAGSGYQGSLWSDPPPSHTLSVNPDATLVGLLLLCAFAVLLVGTARSLSSRHLRSLAEALPIVGALGAVLAIAQLGLTGLEYVDRDRLMGWLLMALPMAVYQAYASRPANQPSPRLRRSAEASATMEDGPDDTTAAESYGGTLRAAGPVLLMCFALVWMALVSLGSATDGATNAIWASWDDTWTQITSFRSVGTGLNTFGTAMIGYQPTILPKGGYNSYLQFAAEGGWLLLVPAAVVLFIFVWQAVRRFLDRSGGEIERGIRAAAVAGLVLVALYELVGLSLQVPGNVALFAVLGGIAISKHR